MQLPPSISASHIEILSAEESIGNTNIERISASLIEKETNNDNNNVVTNNPDQADVDVRAEVEVLDSDDNEDEVEVVIPNTHALIHRSHLSQLKKKAQNYNKLISNLSQSIYHGFSTWQSNTGLCGLPCPTI